MPTTSPGSTRASTSRRLAAAAVAAGALVGGLLVAPAGAQTGPSATAIATCVDGVDGLEVDEDPIDVLTTEVTVDCAAAPTTTTTAPPTTAAPAPATAPAVASRPAASLEFTG